MYYVYGYIYFKYKCIIVIFYNEKFILVCIRVFIEWEKNYFLMFVSGRGLKEII